jgi:hypothetical protein
MKKMTLDMNLNYTQVVDDRYLPTLAQLAGIKSEEEWERRKLNKQIENDI